MRKTYTALVRREGDGYVAFCPEIGTTSQGGSIEEAIANLKEATQLYVEEFPRTDDERPLLATFEVTVADP
jgi:predicted RNase H-like HicB family nuclease